MNVNQMIKQFTLNCLNAIYNIYRNHNEQHFKINLEDTYWKYSRLIALGRRDAMHCVSTNRRNEPAY